MTYSCDIIDIFLIQAYIRLNVSALFASATIKLALRVIKAVAVQLSVRAH